MASPSNYLEATQKRFKDRASLIRRDIDIMLEGLSSKKQFLGDLRTQTLRHRSEDVAQLAEARLQLWASWDERLKRIEEWMRVAAELKRSSSSLNAWRESARGFERLQSMADRYKAGLERRARTFGDDLAALTDSMNIWDGRLRVKEAEVRAFLDKQTSKTSEIMVSKARKKPFLDFVYLEREEEGRLALRMKAVRSTVNRMLERLTRAQEWVVARAAQNPEEFGARKDAFLETLKPFHKLFTGLRESALEQALAFEGGRQRLRWIYEQVQRMRVVQETPSERAPLLERLFKREF